MRVVIQPPSTADEEYDDMDAPADGADGDAEPKPLGQAQLQAKVRPAAPQPAFLVSIAGLVLCCLLVLLLLTSGSGFGLSGCESAGRCDVAWHALGCSG
jgi:hypothetical protein